MSGTMSPTLGSPDMSSPTKRSGYSFLSQQPVLPSISPPRNGPIEPGLWIRFHFLRIRIQLLISMRIRIQQLFKCGSRSQSSLTKFVTTYFMTRSKDKKDYSKVKNTGACPHLLYLKKIKLQFLPISLHFFLVFSLKFSPPGSGSTALDRTCYFCMKERPS